MNVLTDNWDLFRTGFLNTLKLLALSGVLSLVIGTLLAAMRVSPVPAMRAVGASYVNVFRNTPLTLVFFFAVFGLPAFGVELSFFARAVIALTTYTSAFICEAVRSGINTVPLGQAEAARAIGMGFGQTLRYVVLPQAIRTVVPPIASVVIALAKNTTVAAGFSILEAGAIIPNLSERDEPVVIGLIWIVAGFLLIVLPLAAVQRRLEHSWAVSR